jgi:hypothetical protein
MIITASMCLAVTVLGQSGGAIVMTGSFLGDGPWARASGRWLLLAERDDGFELREVVATSTRVKPVCGDVGFSVEVVEVPQAKSQMLLIRGFPTVKAGPVVTAFKGTKFLLPGEFLHLPLGTEHWALHAFGTARPTNAGGLGEPQFTAYQVQMTGRGRMAPVFTIDRLDNDAPPRILWAGDLDADNVPDIFYSHSYRFVLMLSSTARNGQFVSEAASFHHLIC